LSAFFSENDSVFLSSQTAAEFSLSIKKWLHDFVVQQYKTAITHELDGEKKNLDKLNDNLDDLIKANEKSNKRINENNRKIDKAKDEISTNKSEQESRSDEIINQKKIVRALKGSTGPEKEKEEDKLKDLEKEKRKLEKQNEKLHSEIEDLEADIRDYQRNIEKNDDAQKIKKEEISQQKEVVRNVEKKLGNVK
jgi:chromosome segregation ATPase